ncbi:protein FMC1 homolog [Trichonephila clavata]|uniref:Protein FMC1 homolog n=1 Tax=Trichonephila clavata TaxID=2740835 RepID=A0A8X6HDH1_TRICU|nr:protein FMC1 homolog [Trichonephila clavata]
MNNSRSLTLSVLRGITHELRRANPNLKPISQGIAFSYLINEYRRHQITEKRTCKSEEELHTMAKTYLCYLRSLRENQELIERYHSHGERSVEETARLVGFSLPKTTTENSDDKEI